MSHTRKPRVDQFGKAVARQLNARRAHQGLTQADLERLTQISQSQLSKQLRGLRAIDLDEFDSICVALSIPMEDILALAENELGRRQLDELSPRRQSESRPTVQDLGAFAADSSPDEPEEGDDGFGEGP